MLEQQLNITKISFLKKSFFPCTAVKNFYIALKYSPKVPSGPEKFSASVFAKSDPVFDMQCGRLLPSFDPSTDLRPAIIWVDILWFIGNGYVTIWFVDYVCIFLKVWFKNRRAKCRQQQSAATKQPTPHTTDEESSKNNGSTSTKRPKLVKTSQHSDSSGNNPSESPSSSSTVNSYPSPSNISSTANMDSYISTPTLDNFWSTSGGVNSMPILSPSTDNGLRQSSLSLQVKASNISPSHRSATDSTNTGLPTPYNTNTYYSAAHVPPPPPPPPPPPTVPAASGMDLSYFGHHSNHYNSYINHHHGSTAAGMLRSTASTEYDYNIVASAAAVDRYQQL